MKRKNTLWSLVLALVMVLGVFAPLSALADTTLTPNDGKVPGTEGSPKNITVNVHKILMNKEDLAKHDAKKEYRPANKITDIKGFFGDSATHIKGVYFVAIEEKTAPIEITYREKDATADTKKTVNGYDDFESFSAEEQAAYIAAYKDELSKSTDALKKGQVVEGLTNNDGILELKLKSPGNYKIFEVKSLSKYDEDNKDPATRKMLAESKAVPVILKLPEHARTEDGIADAINVYPKNTDDTPTVDKKVVKRTKKVTTLEGNKKKVTYEEQDEKEAYFDKGEEHTWAIEATIPSGFKDYEIFKLTDNLRKALTYVADQKIDVTVPDNNNIVLKENTHYTVKAPKGTEGGTLEVTFTKAGITELANAVGSKVRVEFKTTINDNAVMSKNIPNGVELVYGHNPDNVGKTKPGEEPRVYTGGKRFVKVDEKSNPIKTTEGKKPAKFVVMREEAGPNGENQYLVEKDGKYSWKVVADEKASALKADKELKVLTADDNGAFEIKGLLYDRDAGGTKYKLVEIEAPTDYSLSDTAFEFTVNDTSYYSTEKLKAMTDETPGNTPGDVDPLKIKNIKITIPETGGMGTMIFMVAGLALMGGAFIAMRKRSAEQA